MNINVCINADCEEKVVFIQKVGSGSHNITADGGHPVSTTHI